MIIAIVVAIFGLVVFAFFQAAQRERMNSEIAKKRYNAVIDIDYKNFDYSGFQLVGCVYGKNNTGVYVITRLTENDRSMHFDTATEPVYLYTDTDIKRGYVAVEQVKSADPASFRVFGTDPTTCFAKDKNSVWYVPPPPYISIEKVSMADPSTFQVIRLPYGKDSEHVFYGSALIENAQVSSFEVVDSQRSRDSVSAYYRGVRIPNSDGPTYHLIVSNEGFGTYAADVRQVYFYNDAYFKQYIMKADPVSFKIIHDNGGKLYARDKRAIYYRENELIGADPATFTVIDAPYAKDWQYVFYSSSKIDGADPQTFRVFSVRVTKDKNHAYLDGKVAEEVDAATLHSISGGYGYADKNFEYDSILRRK